MGKIIVREIEGTGVAIVSAWEPTRRSLGGYAHADVEEFGGIPWGRIGTRLYWVGRPELRDELDRDWLAEVERARGYDVIRRECPWLETADGARWRDGEVEIRAAA